MKLEPSAIQLQFVPLDRLLLHEEDDPFRVKRLVRSLQHDGRLRNPPLVAEHEGCYIALDGARLPMGITRHVVAGRALGLDIPLERLTGDQPLDVKNQWLRELIARRLKANKIRLYQEPVFVFDE